MVVTTPLGEQILRTSIFKGCEILVEGVALKASIIPLEMFEFKVILGMDWFSNHRASMDCFTKNIVFKKSRYPDLEFEGDRRILPTCVISALEVKRLLHKRWEAYLAHVVNKSTLEVDLDSMHVLHEFWKFFLKIYQVFLWTKS